MPLSTNLFLPFLAPLAQYLTQGIATDSEVLDALEAALPPTQPACNLFATPLLLMVNTSFKIHEISLLFYSKSTPFWRGNCL